MRPSLLLPKHTPTLLRQQQQQQNVSRGVFGCTVAAREQGHHPHHHQQLQLHTAATSTTSSSSTSSVNADEISHFSALASSWWDPHGPSRPLHLMNPLRHDFIADCLASSPEAATPLSPPAAAGTQTRGLRYLDVGCGGGIFAESAARRPGTHSVTAIDPSATILGVARQHARRDPTLTTGTPAEPKLQYLNASIETLPLPAAPERLFDVVTLFEVVEHVDRPAAFLDACGWFVRPGGWLVLSTIARTWTSWLTTNVLAEDVLRVVPRGTHDWRKYINADELRAHFEDGARPVVMGVVYVPGLGWKKVGGSEKLGNYFFAVQKRDVVRDRQNKINRNWGVRL
ncbi:S-adenosyl-L-methionine-dependent methyltransferase [Lasiosphaeria miniovina]|uniref:Ubiquinone biosynthesis O-methyltransferase, mitochondrial n=1 Tax=Lasiosphaeria miniovina TaxID=1954250 RepID=A0AA40A5X2_9PEZI|nr:S-adenosyl-L-methionine-dependent methyltransferase [Lasiosphaeria miniovina]KAK0709786.1 S-adenosyl-L-methionine-dependent methyltransferase [Lasiosphaeria miniovina]